MLQKKQIGDGQFHSTVMESKRISESAIVTKERTPLFRLKREIALANTVTGALMQTRTCSFTKMPYFHIAFVYLRELGEN